MPDRRRLLPAYRSNLNPEMFSSQVKQSLGAHDAAVVASSEVTLAVLETDDIASPLCVVIVLLVLGFAHPHFRTVVAG